MAFFRSFTPSEFATQCLFYCDAMGIIDDPNFMLERKTFKNNLLLYVAKGQFHIHQNGHHIMTQGDLVIMNLVTPHKYYADPLMDCALYWMDFGEGDASKLLEYIDCHGGMPYIINDSTYHKAFETLFDLVVAYPPRIEYEISSFVYNICLGITTQINEAKVNHPDHPERLFINTVKHYIETHIEETITLDDFARSCNMSKYYFIKIFKLYIEDTPMRYFYRMKIDHSKKYLSYSNESIGNIAMKFGFDSQSHYSRVFKQYTSLTPTQFRQL